MWLIVNCFHLHDTEDSGMLGPLVVCLWPLASLYKRMRAAGHPTELVSLIADRGLLALRTTISGCWPSELRLHAAGPPNNDCGPLTFLSKQIGHCWPLLAAVSRPLLAAVSRPLASFQIGSVPLAFLQVGCGPLASFRIGCGRLASFQIRCGPLASLRVGCRPLASFQIGCWPLASFRVGCGPLASFQISCGPLASFETIPLLH